MGYATFHAPCPPPPCSDGHSRPAVRIGLIPMDDARRSSVPSIASPWIHGPPCYPLTRLAAKPLDPSMHHSANVTEVESETVIRRQQRIGISLLLLFSAAYGGFIGLCTFAHRWFSETEFQGIPWTVLYGVGLVLLSLLIAMLYGWLSRQRR